MSNSLQSPAPFPALPTQAAPAGVIWTYAGFWWRAIAIIVDWMLISIVDTLIGVATGLRRFGITFDDDSATRQVSDVAYTSQFVIPTGRWHMHGGALSLIGLVLVILYFTLFESSRWQATIGKRVCKLRVTDLAGQRIGIGRACGRYLGKFVSGFILGIGFMMAGWTRRKQALHDLMADTLVMRVRPSDMVFGFQPPQPPGSSGVA